MFSKEFNLRHVLFLITILLGDNQFVFGAYHYPDHDDHRKPCARLKPTVNTQAEICTPDGTGGFKFASVQNCLNVLKPTCPEFSDAECTFYHLAWPDTTVPPSDVPCCRLWYSAEGYTWMEVYYTNFYRGLPITPDKDPGDIVEVHRLIKNHKAFGDRDQLDWPDSVMRSTGERGLSWTFFTDNGLKSPLPTVLTTKGKTPICGSPEGNLIPDDRCDKDFKNYLQTVYPLGFGENHVELSAAEIQFNAVVTMELIPRCMWSVTSVMDTGNHSRITSCQVIYNWRSKYVEDDGTPHDISFEYAEAQIFWNPGASGPSVKYAYWSQEIPEARIQIFSNPV